MKLQDFDFRIWDIREQCYLNENYLENSPFQAIGLVKAHKNSFFGGNFNEVALFSAGKDEEYGFGWNSGGDDNDHELELWSGFYDSKGTKIYEGDIICIDSVEYVVGFDSTEFYLVNKEAYAPQDEEMVLGRFKDRMQISTSIEVVGNIHENPKLLKETK